MNPETKSSSAHQEIRTKLVTFTFKNLSEGYGDNLAMYI